MAKRRKTPKKSGSRKRTYRNKKNYKKLVLIVSIFSILFIVSILNLVYLKDLLNSGKIPRTSKVHLNEKIEMVDKSLKEILFDLGVSSSDIVKEKTTLVKEDEIEWELKESEIVLKTKFDEKEFKRELKSKLDHPNVKVSIKADQKKIKTNIKTFGYETHRFIFYIKIENTKITKTQQKTKLKQIFSKKDKDTKLSKVDMNKDADKSQLLYKNEVNVLSNKNKPKVVIIIDDVGLDRKIVDKIVNINKPLNIAILPYLPYSEYAARKAHKKGMDVLLHLPMEPKESSGYSASDAGEGVLRVGYSKEEVVNKLNQNLSAIPYLNGVNNHMGSKFTENKELMEIVLKKIKAENLYFIDSLTSNRSHGFPLAKKLGVKADKRDIFLDNSSKDKNYVKSQLNKLVRIAERDGVAIGICHPYIQTVDMLEEYLPVLEKKVEISTITSVLN
ncbi:MAG: hypothetical protein GTO02_22120 [Candidatus Dadabacteria bacterium]|nr:hypothetical protein [Candidatus Dadabacteria bacterium]NIQ16979.1 hypothetical protein [Candidatus Dadabacteria bacterium]